ncbi:hypothetical protein [Massilia antarctica]|uniref:hypothetical protein n=1 Tax=Massilia antarctica TaxID=2765360 RepID=UPI00226EBF30|nr:hypothetical protein [Massilia sp. H27-R4]
MLLHTYRMTHTSHDGKVTPLAAPLGGDADARYWGKLVVERDGGSIVIPLQVGTTFVWPA